MVAVSNIDPAGTYRRQNPDMDFAAIALNQQVPQEVRAQFAANVPPLAAANAHVPHGVTHHAYYNGISRILLADETSKYMIYAVAQNDPRETRHRIYTTGTVIKCIPLVNFGLTNVSCTWQDDKKNHFNRLKRHLESHHVLADVLVLHHPALRELRHLAKTTKNPRYCTTCHKSIAPQRDRTRDRTMVIHQQTCNKRLQLGSQLRDLYNNLVSQEAKGALLKEIEHIKL